MCSEKQNPTQSARPDDQSNKTDRKKEPSALLGPLLGFCAGALATIVGFYSGVLDREVKDRQVDVEVMRVAFDVLKLPIEQTGATYRNWACEVLNAHTQPELKCSADDAANAVLADLGRFQEFTLGDRDLGKDTQTDIGLYVCESSDEQTARRVAAAVREAGFGDIVLRRWNLFDEISRSDLSGKISVIYDRDHPEAGELPKIEGAISAISLGPIVNIENTGAETRWFISIVICDMSK